MIRKKTTIIIIILLVAAFIGGLLLVLNGRNNSVTVLVDTKHLPVSVLNQDGFVVSKNNDSFNIAYDENDYLYSFVSVSGLATDFYDLRDLEELVVVFSEEKDETPPALSTIEQRYRIDGIELKTLKSYDEDRWVIAVATTPDLIGEGSIGIYSVVSGEYIEIFSGTGPDLDTLLGASVPENIALNILEDYSAISQL